jgi:ABC-2 type transport system ATP-binding protein
VLILDEPTDGLDPNQKQVVRRMIEEMASEKVIIFSTHVLEEVDAVCSRAIVISEGKVVADAHPDALRKRSRTYNAVTLRVAAGADEAKAAFSALAGVASVQVETEGDGTNLLCRILPRDGRPIAAAVMETAAARKWLVTGIHTDGGRLDDVFRDLTITEDVALEAK